MLPPYVNEKVERFTTDEERLQMKKAIEFVNANLGKEYDLIIGGEKVKGKKKINSINPSKTSEVVGVINLADQALAEKAIETAYKTYDTYWRNVPAEHRARILVKAAAIIRRRKFELASWMVVEVGKNWVEAVADVAEAIDFCEYYARGMMDYAGIQHAEPFPGEENSTYWKPIGVVTVIPPWNFPFAILVGMSVAAVVTGNTVVLKPASISGVIAAKFMEVMEEAGIPPGVINFIPGGGGEIGDFIVTHPKVRMIAFTGSRDVGTRINELAAKVGKGQKWLKRVIAEMGGKDTIVVDEISNLEEAAREIAMSAYGFQGQKCSACSRVVAVKDIYKELIDRVVAIAESYKIGDVRDGSVYLGPVSSEQAFKSIMNYVEIGKKESKLATGGEAGPKEGYFIKPTVFGDVEPKAVISQEEIFGPVCAFLKAGNFKEAIEIANGTDYGLTGAAFSKIRANLEYAREEFFVGNLYLNRKCTGALVGVQPFGGFNMSGTDSKAGCKEYLLLFMQGKSVTERF